MSNLVRLCPDPTNIRDQIRDQIAWLPGGGFVIDEAGLRTLYRWYRDGTISEMDLLAVGGPSLVMIVCEGM